MNENGRKNTHRGGYTGEGETSVLTPAQALRNDIVMRQRAGENKNHLLPLLKELAEAEQAENKTGLDFDTLLERVKSGEVLSELDREVLSELDLAEKAFDRLDDFRRRRAPRAWLFKDWVPAQRVTLLTGTGGFGKSTLALILAIAVADSTFVHPFAGMPQAETHGCVVFATYEDELDEFARRIQKAFRIEEQDDMNAIGVSPDDLHVLDMTPHGALWAPSTRGGQHIANRAELTRTGQRLRAYCEQVRARWLVIDPLAAAYLSDENNRGLVRAFMSDWDAWSKASGCAVLFIAHPPKSSSNTYSGSTDWHAAARAVLMLEYSAEDDGENNSKKKTRCLELQHVKASYAPKHDPVPLVWEKGTLIGKNENEA